MTIPFLIVKIRKEKRLILSDCLGTESRFAYPIWPKSTGRRTSRRGQASWSSLGDSALLASPLIPDREVQVTARPISGLHPVDGERLVLSSC